MTLSFTTHWRDELPDFLHRSNPYAAGECAACLAQRSAGANAGR